MKKTILKIAALFLLFFCSSHLTAAQQSVQSLNTNERIRTEAADNSQIMRTLHYLSDVYGARLTGSPNYKAAADWTIKQMKDWGFDNVHLEPWSFGHSGWRNERASGFIIAPGKDNLTFEVLSWTPGTNGLVRGQAFQLILPEKPTQAELTNYFNGIKNQIAGKIILVGKPAVIPVNFDPPVKRLDDEELRQTLFPNQTPAPVPTPAPNVSSSPNQGQLTAWQISEQLNKFLLDNKAAVRLNDAGRSFGQIRAFNNPTFDINRVVPTMVLRNEDFRRITRLLADNTPVLLEFDVRNRVFPEGKISFNVVGEITGTDKKDEVIMIGAHLDSWHAATGVTDNAVGCAMMMEAARIIKALGLKPRRTIRVALWSGEEQGLLGSQAYVKEHFGTAENPTAEFAKFGGYFNIVSGTGRARGMWIFGPPDSAAILSEIIKPFSDLGVVGALNFDSRQLGGSDNSSFSRAGLPGIRIIQDPIEYGSHTWHTNLDTYERIIEKDAKDAAVVIAGTVYQLAMQDELLPRFKTEEMPKLPVEP